MTTTRYLVVFHTLSAGLNGAALGSDEQEIVYIVAIVIDAKENKVTSCRSSRGANMLRWRR
jgi:hypothetical protein